MSGVCRELPASRAGSDIDLIFHRERFHREGFHVEGRKDGTKRTINSLQYKREAVDPYIQRVCSLSFCLVTI